MARWRRLGGPAMCITVGAVAVLLRLPFLTSGLGEDEGGYAYVARAWGHGAHLYTAAWVDRPQGLLLAYRAGNHDPLEQHVLSCLI